MQVEQLSKARRYMAEELIWTYAIQALEGLTHLHSLGILHRDLKPANIMLCLDGTIKLGDLNVSKLAKFSLVKTQIGTPYYMSPEIWNNKPYGDRSDMWALGCVIYELAALKPPFQGRNIDELSRKVQAGYFPRVPAHYSKDLEELISSLLRKNARQRPSASALLKSGLITKKRAELRRWMDETRRVRDAGTTGPVISKLELRPLSRGRCLRPAAEALLLATCPGASNLCAAAAANAAARWWIALALAGGRRFPRECQQQPARHDCSAGAHGRSQRGANPAPVTTVPPPRRKLAQVVWREPRRFL